ncbi:MAG: hypothetical protein WCX79_00400 [Candidatus Paceibacterota bacterium]|jgi:hypothetical protein
MKIPLFILILMLVCILSMAIAVYLRHPFLMIIAMPIMMVASIMMPDKYMNTNVFVGA